MAPSPEMYGVRVAPGDVTALGHQLWDWDVVERYGYEDITWHAVSPPMLDRSIQVRGTERDEALALKKGRAWLEAYLAYHVEQQRRWDEKRARTTVYSLAEQA